MLSSKKLETMKRLQEEFKDLNRRPIPGLGITVGLFDDNNLFEWKCTILGPADSSYKGGLFHLKIIFPDDYPNSRPEIIFMNPIYHLNVKYFVNGTQPLGHICVNTLNKWKSEYRINKVLPEIFALFSQNNPDSPYDTTNNDRRNEFIHNRALFEKKAKYFTKKYAKVSLASKSYPDGWDFTYK